MNFSENIFYKIINGQAPSYKVYEDDDFFVILDINPANMGHSLILPKIPARDIFDLNEDSAAKLYPMAAKIAKAVQQATNCDGIKVLQNNGSAADQVVFYFHLHIIPFFEGEIRARKSFTAEQFEEMAEKIVGVMTNADAFVNE
ncbi:MAG: HIT domain-containing protein [Clostridiales bacterium]|jgi:histidine triad (HIT) family protein|nr:HIT domain-containing protein [Clostridiales bacterium]